MNWNAKNYIDLIDWSKCIVTEPLLTINISTNNLVTATRKKSTITVNKFTCPCETMCKECQ